MRDEQQAMLLVGFMILVFGATALVAWLVNAVQPRIGSERYGNMRALVQELARITGLAPDADFFPNLSAVKLYGQVAGKNACVRFDTVNVADLPVERVLFFVVATDAPDLVVTEETFGTKLEKMIYTKNDHEIGDAEFDARFFLKTKNPAKASRLLRGTARAAITRIFDCGAGELRFEDRDIVVIAPTKAIEARDYGKVLEALAKLSSLLDSQPLKVSVLGGVRRGHVDEKGKIRCPYCRENITGDEPDLVACEKCKSVVHDECWHEHDGCPLLGCEGGAVERPRSRERA